MPARCHVAFCRAEEGHRDLHDIPACLPTCGPIRPVVGRKHDPACPNVAYAPPQQVDANDGAA